MRRRRPLPGVLICSAALLAAAAGPSAAPAATLGGWDKPAQKVVLRAGIMQRAADGAFHGERPLTGPQLAAALTALPASGDPEVLAPAPPASLAGATTLPVDRFDRLLVAQLGLGATADAVQAEAASAGLRPPPRFGTEVVARLLGLRTNHAQEDLEPYPWSPITRAEAAWSLAQAMRLDAAELAWTRDTLARFVLPAYTPAQLAPLRIAVSKIGMPYIWGGESDTAGPHPWGWQAVGGYDCSGFAWRVFKTGGLPAGRSLRGRTAAQQAGEIPRAARLHRSQLRGGDLVFFGPGRFWQAATERRIVHMGIALSPDWMIHASAQGVYVSPLFDPWRAKRFSWGRRMS